MADAKEKYTAAEAKKLEDDVISIFASKPPEWQATTYTYLYACGHRLKSAQDIKRKKGITRG